MTPEVQAALAIALDALAQVVRKSPTTEERVLPLDEALARLGITYEVFRKRKLAREMPVIAYSNETKGIREVSLNEFIRTREKLARRRLKDVSKKSA
jgi:hypothetical protein